MKIPLSDAVSLLHRATHCVLASNSSQLPGYPYATALPLVVDETQSPIILISALAEHTKNLLSDDRASLSVIDPALTKIQNRARMTLVGRFHRLLPSPETMARYLRYRPEANDYLQLDFMFFRMAVERIRFIGGVGRMGWLEAADWNAIEVVPAAVENALLEEIATSLKMGMKAIGLDAYGLDIEVGSGRLRSSYPTPQTAASIGDTLPNVIEALNSEQFLVPS